jgi:uncharacterized protein YndB with AHSA1/START domain
MDAMQPIVSTVEIARPPAEVFAYATNPARFPEWQKDVVSVDFEGEPGIGTRFRTTRRIGPRQQTIVQEITEVDPPHRWAARGVGGPFRANGRISVEPLAGGTWSMVTFALDYEADGAGKLLLPLVARMTRAGAPKSYANLKRLLERSASLASGSG